MQGAWCVIWLALLCGGCAAHSAVPTSSAPASSDILHFDNKPVGYYPGIAWAISTTPDLRAWLASNQQGIDDIQNRIKEIKDGRRIAGCIGEHRYTCVATLAQRFAIADSYLAKDANVFSPIRYDVNGKPIELHIELYGFAPKAKPGANFSPNANPNPLFNIQITTKFSVTLGRDGSVASVKVRLPNDPTFARTQEEYDATHVYETVAAVTAQSCPALSKAEVAKWMENTIKPSSKSYRGKVHRGVTAARISEKVKFCGRSFQFDSLWSRQTYNQYHADVNGGMFIVVE